MKPMPGSLKTTIAVIMVASFFVLLIASPEHNNDPLFWWLLITVGALSWLAIILGSEADKESKQLFIWLFFMGEALLMALLAGAYLLDAAREGKLF